MNCVLKRWQQQFLILASTFTTNATTRDSGTESSMPGLKSAGAREKSSAENGSAVETLLASGREPKRH